MKKTKRKIAAILSLVLAGSMIFSSCKGTGAQNGNTSEPGSDPGVAIEPAQIDLVNDSVPNLYLWIDENAEGYGTIEEMNADFFHETKCTGTMDLEVPSDYTGGYGDSVQETLSDIELDYVRGRGNSTWMLADKKPYKIKLAEKTDLFGMGEAKEWALLANRNDSSLLRNRITFWLGEKMGLDYTPKGVPVNLYMNDENLGSYLLTGLVEIKKNRVEVKDPDDGDVNGGYLFAVLDPDYVSQEPEDNWIVTKEGVYFVMDTPSFEAEDGTGTEEQKEYISNYLQEAEDAIFSNAGSDKIAQYIDLESTADYWWIEEFCSNEDGFKTTSAYLYKDADGTIHFGPLWDFDSAWEYNMFNPRPTEGFNTTSMAWIDHMRQEDPEFVNLLKERFEVFDAALEELTEDGGVLDCYSKEIKTSWEKDNEIWGVYDRDMMMAFEADNENAATTQEEAVEALRTWINARREWMKANLDELDKVYFDVTLEADGETFDTIHGVKYQSLTGRVPDGPDIGGKVFKGWYEKNGGSDIKDTVITEDTVFVAEYTDEGDVGKPEKVYFTFGDEWCPVSDSYYYPSFTTLPYDAADRRMEWKSSDEKIAEVDECGRIKVLKEGNVTITATLPNGEKDSFVLHVYDPETAEKEKADNLIAPKEAITLNAGEYTVLKTSVDNGEKVPLINPTIEYDSDDPSVATIDENGIITAVGEGTTDVYAFVSYGGGGMVIVSVTVNPAK